MFWKTGTIYRQEVDKGGGAPPGDEPATPDNTISDEPVSPPITDQPTEPAPKEGGPEKVVDPAVREEKEQLYQTQYQSLLALTQEKAPEVVREFKGEPVAPKVPEDDLDQPAQTLGDMTPAEFTKALTKANQDSIKSAIAEARTEDRVAQERAYTHNTLRGIQETLGLDAKTLGNGKVTAESKVLSDKIWKDAMEAAGQFGIDLEVVGGYGKLGIAMAQELRLAALTGGQVQQVAQATQTVEEQTREALLVQQPAKGAVPTQKPKTKQQEAIERMERVKPRSAVDLLDSTHK